MAYAEYLKNLLAPLGIYDLAKGSFSEAMVYAAGQALDQAEREHRDYTDDCQLAEGIGAAVQLVPGDYDNIKITTPEDLDIAEVFAKQQRTGRF